MADSKLDQDLEECAREPIHISGAIQPHGLLIGFDAGLSIHVVSENVEQHLGLATDGLLGHPLASVLDPLSLERLRIATAKPNPRGGDALAMTAAGREFEGHLSRSGELFLLELEPNEAGAQSPSELLDAVEQLSSVPSLEELLATTVRAIKSISGFDRVMIYRFLPTGAGEVIAELAEDTMEPYLHLCYPASDIPAQARRLYLLNWTRTIADVNYHPARLVPGHNPLDGQPIDLSFVGLRSVSRVHLEYLRNMGPGICATMSLSLLSGNRLWGLIACHHRQPRLLSPSRRRACELAARVFSAQLPSVERAAEGAVRLRSAFVGVDMLEAMSTEATFADGLRRVSPMMLDLVVAEGAATLFDDTWTLEGRTPPLDAVKALAAWISTRETEAAFNTQTLCDVYPGAVPIKEVASGILAACFGQARGMLLWFRPEVIETVTWAGNPELSTEAEGRKRLSPRKSFAAWQRTVACTSRPWAEWEIAAATRLRDAINGLWLRREAETHLNVRLVDDLRARDAFLATAAHELRNSITTLQLQVQLLSRAAREPNSAEVSLSTLQPRLNSACKQICRLNDLVGELLDVSRLTERPLHLEGYDLREQVEELVKVMDAQLAESGCAITVDAIGDTNGVWDRLRVDQAITNIVTNAMKYGAGKPIEIHLQGLDDCVRIAIVDHGIGIEPTAIERIFEPYTRTSQTKGIPGLGLGLWITRQVALRLGGSVRAESAPGRGSTFTLTLPRR